MEERSGRNGKPCGSISGRENVNRRKRRPHLQSDRSNHRRQAVLVGDVILNNEGWPRFLDFDAHRFRASRRRVVLHRPIHQAAPLIRLSQTLRISRIFMQENDQLRAAKRSCFAGAAETLLPADSRFPIPESA